MSYHLNMQKSGKVPDIEMPPLPQEAPQVIMEAAQVPDVHPELAKEFQQSVDPVENQTENEPEVSEKHAKPEAEENTKGLRKIIREKAEKAERAERERDDLMRKLESYERLHNALDAQPKSQLQVKDEDDIHINPDDFVEAKHLNKYDQKIKKLQDELKSYQQQNTVTATEARLKNEFPDFDKVVSKDNIDQLRYEYPELAETLNNSSTDLYAKAKSAYTLIKKLGIVTEDVFQADRERAVKNASKPRPLASVNPQQGESPLTKANAFANGLTDELKLQLRKEMEAARRAI